MKKYTLLFYIVLLLLFSNSCLDKYLDIAPESGLSEEIVFSKYENFLKYFNTVYYGRSGTGNNSDNIQCCVAIKFNTNGYKLTWESLTDMSDQGRTGSHSLIRNGSFIATNLNNFCYGGNYQNILQSMFTAIRTSNTAIQKYVMVKDAKQEDLDDLLAQAHFIRAFAHFELFRVWGPMPYLTHAIGPYDQWDIPRLTKNETLMRIAADLDTAITYYEKANTMRRDPVFGGVGHLNSPKQSFPNGVAAKAWKARVLLYAASPLNNEHGIQDWEEAAKANWAAIELALQYGYNLLSAADYNKNTIGAPYTNEQLWGWDAGTMTYSGLASIVNGIFAGAKTGTSGEGPAQGFVDRFETKWGDPLTTQAERDAAAALGHFNEQDPYTNRDPRFYLDIIYNTKPIVGFDTARIYYENVGGTIKYSELLDHSYVGITQTGYYQSKLWDGQSVKNKVEIRYTESMIRLGELYLNYAEAANEAYGPNTPAPGATLSAVQAINIIRNRIGMPDVLPEFTLSKETFRERIKNERIVELCWEGGSYYFDTRRWKDAPKAMAGPMMGVSIEKVPKSAMYPTGYKYTRVPLPSDHQSSWNDKQYYFPFLQKDLDKMKNFDASINQW